MFESLAVVGATGAVGRLIRRLLEERSFPLRKVKFLASGRSAGTQLTFRGETHTVELTCPEAFDGVDLCIASTPDEVAREFVPWAVERGVVVVDESAAWRMDPKVPLVVPEVNPEAIRSHQGILASPNCSTTQMVVAMKPLHDFGRIRRVIVSTYQATSGAGVVGEQDLIEGTRAALDFGGVSVSDLQVSDRLQPDSADWFAKARGIHIRRDEDGVGNAQDLR